MSAEAKKKRFEVTDEASAEWAMEKLEENAKARALIDEQYERMIARHEAWREDALKEIEESDAYFQSLLRPWAEAKLAGGKKKSVKLPSGTVGFRAGSGTYKFGDERETSCIRQERRRIFRQGGGKCALGRLQGDAACNGRWESRERQWGGHP